MNRWKSAAALAGAALILAGSLAACAPQEEASSQTGETSSQLALENDETATSLVVAELFARSAPPPWRRLLKSTWRIFPRPRLRSSR